MNTVFIDKSNEQISVKENKLFTSKHTIPLRLIDLLVLTQEINIQTKDILKLTKQNIPILYLSKDSKNFALTLPQFSKNSDLKVMQYNALYKRVDIAKHLLYEKFTTHQTSLKQFDIEIDISHELSSLALSTSIEEMMGIEGAYARKYFGHYFSLFERKLTRGFRSKNPPLDPVNAMLSFVYTLGYNSLTAKLYMRGFDPSISYLHTPFRNHFALSSDILEPLRADINNFVASLFLDKVICMDYFSFKNGVYLKYESRRRLWKHLKPFMDTLNKKANKKIVLLKKEIYPKETLS